MDFSQLQVVSWDVDGTLYSLRRMKYEFLRLSINRLCSRQAPRHWRELVSLYYFRRLIRRIRTGGGDLGNYNFPKNRADIISIEEHWYGKAIERAGVQSGIVELIDWFRLTGLRQIIISDYVSSYKLDALGLNNIFETSYAGETLGHIKPSPNLFLDVTKDLKVEPKRLIHIGDRANRDGTAAMAAGCQVIIFGEQYRNPRDLLAAVTNQ